MKSPEDFQDLFLPEGELIAPFGSGINPHGPFEFIVCGTDLALIRTVVVP
jgi:hypothetical protein